jgi:hypothetical protein
MHDVTKFSPGRGGVVGSFFRQETQQWKLSAQLSYGTITYVNDAISTESFQTKSSISL